jgi:hypothetical protein
MNAATLLLCSAIGTALFDACAGANPAIRVNSDGDMVLATEGGKLLATVNGINMTDLIATIQEQGKKIQELEARIVEQAHTSFWRTSSRYFQQQIPEADGLSDGHWYNDTYHVTKALARWAHKYNHAFCLLVNDPTKINDPTPPTDVGGTFPEFKHNSCCQSNDVFIACMGRTIPTSNPLFNTTINDAVFCSMSDRNC